MRPSFSMLPGNFAGRFFCAENHVFFLLDFLSPAASESFFHNIRPRASSIQAEKVIEYTNICN